MRQLGKSDDEKLRHTITFILNNNILEKILKDTVELSPVKRLDIIQTLIKAINNSDIIDKDRKISEFVLKFNSFINNRYKIY